MINMYKYLLFFLVISIFISSCSEDEELITVYEQSVIDYFIEVGLGSESGNIPAITRKWITPMKIFIKDEATIEFSLDIIKQSVDEFNSLVTDGFTVEIVNDSIISNAYLFLGTVSDFENLYPDLPSPSITGFASVYTNNNNNIYKVVIFINPQILFSGTRKKNVIKEELMHSLGFLKHSSKYPESILYSDSNSSNPGFSEEYSQRDRDIIRLLYHPSVSSGLDSIHVAEILKNILKSE